MQPSELPDYTREDMRMAWQEERSIISQKTSVTVSTCVVSVYNIVAPCLFVSSPLDPAPGDRDLSLDFDNLPSVAIQRSHEIAGKLYMQTVQPKL